MASLIERLQAALHPHFTVLREIAGGGMAVVFLGHDPVLDRPVAIKVLRPELATAIGVERFVREARLLARLRHPHIIPVFQGGEADGLLYHILAFQEGETLAERLARGPLTGPEREALASGLLAALGAAHEAGVVHRDIKPANIFLHDGLAVVGDFGIASTTTAEETLTTPGSAPGTAAYMSPEQQRGGVVTARSDLYSAALVLVEACTGERLASAPSGRAGIWARVPRQWVRPLQHALADDPDLRWESAGLMLAAMHGGRRRWRPALAAVVLGTTVLAGGMKYCREPGQLPQGRFVVGLGELVQVGAQDGIDWADSIRTALALRLRGFPDFVVDTSQGAEATLTVSGRVESRNDSIRVLELGAAYASGSRPLNRGPAVPRSDWLDLVDSMAREVMVAVWEVDVGSLPRQALPQSPPGMDYFLKAELDYRDGAWARAREEYTNTEDADRTCLLCAYRIHDLDRWLNRPVDTVQLRVMLAHLDRFPDEYRALIVATAMPPRQRLDTLRVMAEWFPEFFDIQYLYGDELLHRGPLMGIPRREAVTHLRMARRLRPDFAGVAEHLAWALIAEGDELEARAILEELDGQHPPRESYAKNLREFHQLAWQWRFRPADDAARFTADFLGDSGRAESEYLAAGPRTLPALGVFAGAVGLGQAIAQSGRPELVRSGLLAQTFGHLAQGQFEQAFAAAGRLRDQVIDVETRLVPLQLGMLLRLVGVDGGGELTAMRSRLASFAARRDLAPGVRARVEWTQAMLDPPVPVKADSTPLQRLLAARAEAAQGHLERALEMTESLSEVDYRRQDPAADAAARLLRADWFGQLGRHAEAAAELRWQEHSDMPEIPRGRVQAGEIDWAIGTEAIWLRTRHLEADGERGQDLCAAYAELDRRWAAADPSHAARRDSARVRARQLSCPEAK